MASELHFFTRILMVRFILAAAWCGIAFAAFAQSPPVRYRCDFKSAAGDTLILEYIFEVGSDRAFLIGNAGVNSVVPVVGTDAVSFLEILNSGAVQTTTIARNGSAVHSRHTLMADFIPSQYTGICRK